MTELEGEVYAARSRLSAEEQEWTVAPKDLQNLLIRCHSHYDDDRWYCTLRQGHPGVHVGGFVGLGTFAQVCGARWWDYWGAMDVGPDEGA